MVEGSPISQATGMVQAKALPLLKFIFTVDGVVSPARASVADVMFAPGPSRLYVKEFTVAPLTVVVP